MMSRHRIMKSWKVNRVAIIILHYSVVGDVEHTQYETIY